MQLAERSSLDLGYSELLVCQCYSLKELELRTNLYVEQLNMWLSTQLAVFVVYSASVGHRTGAFVA